MFGLGAPELLLIFFVVLLLFGAKKLPELAQGLGKGIREFKKAMKDTEEDVKGSVDVTNRPPTNQPPYTQPNQQSPYNPPPPQYNPPPPTNPPGENRPNQNH
jgi:sec-independent protein translocase protein TatA